MPRPSLHQAALALALLGERGLGISLQPRTSLDPKEQLQVMWDPEEGSMAWGAPDAGRAADADADDRRSTLSFSNGTGCLTFVHIPKSGGTFVETTKAVVLPGSPPGKQQWGRNDKKLTCHGMHIEPFHKFNRQVCPMKDGSTCTLWHVPPSLDDELEKSYKQGGCESFCVVREPASRFRSQHAWLSQVEGRHHGCDAESLDKAVDEKLKNLDKRPYMDDCHLVPQAVYVNRARGCKHVIRHENFKKEFPELLRRFGIEVKVTEKAAMATGCHANFSRQSMEKIHKYYSQDYSRFGYPKVLPAK